MKAPGVYAFVCPDGRRYVGSSRDCQRRAKYGLNRTNPRLREAISRYPLNQWSFEVLELLPPKNCTEVKLRGAENRHIERLKTRDPQYGFNIRPPNLRPVVPPRFGPLIGVRIPAELVSEIERVAKEEYMDRSQAMRQLIRWGLRSLQEK